MIVLMGIKHSGKTTLGKNLSLKYNIPFWDLDDLLEKEYEGETKLTFREIYKLKGEKVFRELEYKAAGKIDFSSSGVLSLGGGTIENHQAMEEIQKAELLIFLDTEEKILLQRIKAKGLPSFLAESPEKQFHILFERRRKMYIDKADIIIPLKEETIEEILPVLLNKIEEVK